MFYSFSLSCSVCFTVSVYCVVYDLVLLSRGSREEQIWWYGSFSLSCSVCFTVSVYRVVYVLQFQSIV